MDNDQSVKILSVIWNAQSDCISYIVKPIETDVTKSKLPTLSEILQIFDPIELLGQIVL